ncbi:MAG: nuclear transport factor 2 family protein [Pseudomonadota bacterium]|nr:nuclear transport factor 2 family protein [Pseudomonadota bacterium]
MTDIEMRNRKVVEIFGNAFNDHDVDGILEHFAETSVWVLSRGTPPDGLTLHGNAAIGEIIRERFSSIPDIAWENHSHWAGGDSACSE